MTKKQWQKNLAIKLLKPGPDFLEQKRPQLWL